jgi:hypothetical protein
MPTVPPPCSSCKGSGQVFLWLPEPYGVESLKFWRVFLNVGFVVIPCGGCWGHGTRHREPLPDPDASKWPHRVPPEATAGT